MFCNRCRLTNRVAGSLSCPSRILSHTVANAWVADGDGSTARSNSRTPTLLEETIASLTSPDDGDHLPGQAFHMVGADGAIANAKAFEDGRRVFACALRCRR